MEMILILGFGALLIFFMMNSRKKQRQQQEKLSTGLVPGARVMTTFGVFGTVVDVLPEENKVTIESNPGTLLTVHRQAIGQIEAPVSDVPLDDDLADTEVPDDLSSLTPADDRTDAVEDVPAPEADETAASNETAASDDAAEAEVGESAASDETGDTGTGPDASDESDDTPQNRS